ncbi:MAG: hypothetical protein WB615_09630 [Candidatus Tumulicola sp.]
MHIVSCAVNIWGDVIPYEFASSPTARRVPRCATGATINARTVAKTTQTRRQWFKEETRFVAEQTVARGQLPGFQTCGITDRLGHSRIGVTADTYGHLFAEGQNAQKNEVVIAACFQRGGSA